MVDADPWRQRLNSVQRAASGSEVIVQSLASAGSSPVSENDQHAAIVLVATPFFGKEESQVRFLFAALVCIYCGRVYSASGDERRQVFEEDPQASQTKVLRKVCM